MEKLALRGAGAPERDRRVGAVRLGALGLVEAADQRREHVAGLQVEVVARAVQVGRHQVDHVVAVLAVERLGDLDARDLGDGVGPIGRLQRAGQEVLLLHRLGRLARVDAGRAQVHDAPGLAEPRLVGRHQHLVRDREVVADEVGREVAVGEDAAHLGRRQDDVRRLLGVEERADGRAVAEVQLGARARHHLDAVGGEAAHDGGADEPAVARDEDSGIGSKCGHVRGKGEAPKTTPGPFLRAWYRLRPREA